MSDISCALWSCVLGGFLAGFFYRVWCERHALRDEYPIWMGRLGHSLAAQMHDVDQMHRLAGDEVVAVCKKTYEGGDKSFIVRVQRNPDYFSGRKPHQRARYMGEL